MEFKIILLRLSLTFFLALIFGFERQKSHKPVGFGTFIFVSMGSCALAVTALSLGYENPLPLLSAIVTGIGFLGAGALIRTSDKIFGFTTAASIWVFAILGLIIGVGYYPIGLMLYAFVWICIFFDREIESGKIISYKKRIEIKISNLTKENEITELFKKFKIKKYKLISKKINKKEKFIYTNYLLEAKGEDMRKMVLEMEKIPYFEEISLE